MNKEAILQYAQKLYGFDIRVQLEEGGDDWFRFKVDSAGRLFVEAGTPRGVLYSVYRALEGKTSGEEHPQFAIRGLNPCESLARHTDEQITTLIDRMGRWRMNTLIIHSNYGFLSRRQIILRETQKRGIEIVHYTYSNLCFLEGMPARYFAKDEHGEPKWQSLQCETRLCVSDAAGLGQYRHNVRKYLAGHPDYTRMLFCTADGGELCQCKKCRDLGPMAQWQAIFDPFFDEAQESRHLEMLSYVQRFRVPTDRARISRLDRVLFDTHLRFPRTPLGQAHEWMKQGLRHCYPPEFDPICDARGDQPINQYLLDRLVDWRAAFTGQLYVFENLMIQGLWGCPRPNTSIYLEDLRTFKKLGLNEVVYEAFEPGIKPFLPTFEAIAQMQWDLEYPYQRDALEERYVSEGATDGDFLAAHPGHEKWAELRGNYPRSELAGLLYRYHRDPSAAICREVLNYILNHPEREDFDWIYVAHAALKKAAKLGVLEPRNPEEGDFLNLKKLWDFQERYSPGRDQAIKVIQSLSGRVVKQR